MIASDLFAFPQSLPFAGFFLPEDKPWEWVQKIKTALAAFDFSACELRTDIPAGVEISGDVFLHPTVKLPAYAVIQGPAWIGAETEIRPGAFIRGNVIVGSGCVLGNSCEYKNCLLLDGVESPHYNYVGDSVLGNTAHLGAGAICANLRLDRKNVPVEVDGQRVDSGMRKLGALMGDGSEALCNSVLHPGAILGRKACVMTGMNFGGYLEANTIAMVKQEIQRVPRH